MVALSVSRWLLGSLGRRPAFVVVLAGAALAGAAAAALGPRPLPPAPELVGRWGGAAGLAGAAVAAALLAEKSEFLNRAAPAPRWTAETVLAFASAALPQAALAAGVLAAGASPRGSFGALAGGLAATDLHLAGLVLAGALLGLAPAAAGVLVLVLGWSAAALLVSIGGPAALLTPALDVSGHASRFRSFGSAPLAALAGTAPAAGWVALAGLVRARPDPGEIRLRVRSPRT